MARGATAKARRRKKRQTLTPEQRAKNRLKSEHIRSVRRMFSELGFDRVAELSEKQFRFQEQDGEFDDVYSSENLLIFVEYTTAQASDIKDHLKGKRHTYEMVERSPKGYLGALRGQFPAFDARLGNSFHEDKYLIRTLYCPRFEIGADAKAITTAAVYLEYFVLKYFEKMAATIKMSARSEFFDFLSVDPAAVARDGRFPARSSSVDYHGSILPESASGYPSGYKVVSFYADAAALLERVYVLRRDGWRSTFQAYQRMVQPAKIASIRRRLREDRKVFVNNLIATLPGTVMPINARGHTVDISTLTETAPVRISLPLEANSIGLIDGQHRLFSYYEARKDDLDIAKLRHEQNLLVTGIIYPEHVTPLERERFEASLFLAINTNQTNAPTALRQEIEVVLNPSSPTAIGKQVIQRLAASGPLQGYVQSRFFEKGLLKTTSVVRYGLGPLTKLQGPDSLFVKFEHPEKDRISEDGSALEAYLQFCASSINIFLGAVKANVPSNRWTSDRSNKSRVITVTSVNSFLITMRMMAARGDNFEFSTLRSKLDGIAEFPFLSFHSSQYGRMAEQIFQKYLE